MDKTLPNIVRDAVIYGNTEKYTDGIKQPASMHVFKSLSYTNIIPVLVEAIKEQQKQIELLKKQINK